MIPAGSDDPLAVCLAAAGRLYGIHASVASIGAGLPLQDGRLTPVLAVKAAAQMGLTARIVRTSLADIAATALPVVLLLEGRTACVLYALEGESADVGLADLPDASRRMPVHELAARYTGLAILLGKMQRFPAGTGLEQMVETHHWFWGTFQREIPTYAEVALATVFINLFALVSPLFFMNVYDRVVPNRAMETLWVLSLGFAVVLVFDLVLKLLRGYLIDVAGQRADLALSAALYARVMDLKLDQPRRAAGSLANNLRDFESLREFLTSATLVSLVDLPFVVVFVAALLWIGGLWIALPVLVAIPIVVAFGLMLQPAMRDHIRRSFSATEAKYAAAIETLGAIEQVKHLNAAGQLQKKWEGLVRFAAEENLRARLLSSVAINATSWVQAVVSLAVLIVGAYSASTGLLSSGALVACTLIAGRAVGPLTQVAGLLTRYHTAASALRALNAIMAGPVDRPPGKTFIGKSRLQGRIDVRKASFRYPQHPLEALTDVSLAIAPGDRVGVIGRMGSGKSTLAKLLIGLHEVQAGSIQVDGLDIRQLDPTDLRRNIGYMPQNVVLFSGSVRDNLTLGAVHLNDEAMLRAAALVGLAEHINRHPSGFDMPVGERGDFLSGGQKQAVALARALLEDPPILLLDEPTAAMDMASEEEFKIRLLQVIQGRTVIVVTHRESMLSLVDKLVVLDKGRVVAAGPKADVLQALAKGRVRKASA